MKLRIEYDSETRQWASFCDEPPVASCGTTPGEALEAVLEAADLYRATVAQIEAGGGVVHRATVQPHNAASPDNPATVQRNGRLPRYS